MTNPFVFYFFFYFSRKLSIYNYIIECIQFFFFFFFKNRVLIFILIWLIILSDQPCSQSFLLCVCNTLVILHSCNVPDSSSPRDYRTCHHVCVSLYCYGVWKILILNSSAYLTVDKQVTQAATTLLYWHIICWLVMLWSVLVVERCSHRFLFLLMAHIKAVLTLKLLIFPSNSYRTPNNVISRFYIISTSLGKETFLSMQGDLPAISGKFSISSCWR